MNPWLHHQPENTHRLAHQARQTSTVTFIFLTFVHQEQLRKLTSNNQP